MCDFKIESEFVLIGSYAIQEVKWSMKKLIANRKMNKYSIIAYPKAVTASRSRLAEKICKYPYVCQYICFQNAFVAFGLSCAPRAIKMDMEKKYGWQETILGEMSGQVSRTAASCGSPHACFMVECMNSQKDVCINMINQHMCIKKKADLKYRIAMHNVFPITDNIPGHIMCTRAADAHAWTDYLDKFGITGLLKIRASIRLGAAVWPIALILKKTAN
ncbi:hypothetical protein BDEG_26473 [Batrachochytrium dendrobatidis JEL423]|uniref:Uncharacterized protein n=1 Tax=Batrachochytrium dendrobatidis (strain JEL423) TaxID=403673 RepID=A0A177WSJ8_BATDL|nr:hypothetical protein BDEG_26473 [Batrachochytrium dendrobatidis JEL423]